MSDTPSAPPARFVKCPNCRKPSLFSPENPFRPFCSERCRLIDLGEWAEGNYSVPVGPATAINELIDDKNNAPKYGDGHSSKDANEASARIDQSLDGGAFSLFDEVTGLPKEFAESIRKLIPEGINPEEIDDELAAEIAAQLMAIASRPAHQSDDNN